MRATMVWGGLCVLGVFAAGCETSVEDGLGGVGGFGPTSGPTSGSQAGPTGTGTGSGSGNGSSGTGVSGSGSSGSGSSGSGSGSVSGSGSASGSGSGSSGSGSGSGSSASGSGSGSGASSGSGMSTTSASSTTSTTAAVVTVAVVSSATGMSNCDVGDCNTCAGCLQQPGGLCVGAAQACVANQACLDLNDCIAACPSDLPNTPNNEFLDCVCANDGTTCLDPSGAGTCIGDHAAGVNDFLNFNQCIVDGCPVTCGQTQQPTCDSLPCTDADMDPSNDCQSCATSPGGQCAAVADTCAANVECIAFNDCLANCPVDNANTPANEQLDCICNNDGLNCLDFVTPGTCTGDHQTGVDDFINFSNCIFVDACPNACN